MGASPATIGRSVLILCAVAAASVPPGCGARDGLDVDGQNPPSRGRFDGGLTGTAGTGAGTEREPRKPLDDASAPRSDDRGDSTSGARDAASVSAPSVVDGGRRSTGDASVQRLRDAAADSSGRGDAADFPDASGASDSAAPDCACPPDDYFVAAIVGTSAERFEAPYPLRLYCDESAVQIVRTPCSDLYSLSGCAAPGRGAPCLYVAVDLTRGPLIGHYFDSTGQTWDLQTASMTVGTQVGRALDGSFSATFVNLADGRLLTASGTFHACATKMPACRR